MAAKKARRKKAPRRAFKPAKPEPKTAHHKRSKEFRRVAAALAQRLRSAREGRGWTVDRAAQEYGVEPMSVWRLETGEANPTLATLVSIAAALKVSLSELLNEK